ncbi:NACHT domain-containing protein [Leptolyngbya cf. ectocarpi LEGE 11479]|uniref:NACHT domain-containing protein n=1 Tax=Leptolyngbya cf. ectocarpi LEGE 11479 TaxID=1828722 RepID=A0A928X4T6_LEPEC|nr:NACHT domain-containing protein [Leptolyngbya cf. ectocarpi LEGE 11479]
MDETSEFLNMPSIPRSYLELIADQKHLTPLQKEAFVERLANIELSDLVVAKILNISRERYSSRMTKVYKIFNIPSGNTPGKAKILFFKVLDMYQRDHPSDKKVSKLVDSAIDSLVQETQEKTQELINAKCGSMQILDMSKPIEVEDIFTEVKITKQILSKRRIELSELVKIVQEIKPDNDTKLNIARLLEGTKLSGVKLVKNYPKLILLGRPGAGKTTFLKYVAVFVNKSEIIPGYVPVFVSLKDFQNQDDQIGLKEYIANELLNCEVNRESFELLLREAKILFLFDGLDEVRKENFNRVIRLIQEISHTYSKNRFIITCRLAASEYKFESFLEAEVCEFTEEQIGTFSRNWFATKKSPQKTEKFINRIRKDEEISEIATNPLLLTLLCMVFEDSEEFPKNQAELYQEGLDVLLRKWDVSRAVERPETYRKLSKNKKEDLLSKIAYATFEKDEGLFKRKTIENQIREYIYNLPRSISAPEELEPDCNSVLDSMIAQHGLITAVAKDIFSFSHRTFHEYFVSLKIVKTLDPEEQQNVLRSLAIHINDYRWQEVFSLVSCMLPNADYLIRLIKHEIDKIVKENQKIDSFLDWLDQKSSAIKSKKKISNLKAIGQVFYFNLVIKHKTIKTQTKSKDFILDSELFTVLISSIFIQNNLHEEAFDLLKEHKDILSLIRQCIARNMATNLKEHLISLKQELPSKTKVSDEWWIENGQRWSNDFRDMIIRYRNIGHDWGFSESEIKSLKEYYDVNKLLSICLSGDCYVSREVREEINSSTLLPIDKDEDETSSLSTFPSSQREDQCLDEAPTALR